LRTRFDLGRIVNAAIRTIREVQISIRDYIIKNPGAAFDPAQLGRRGKPLLTIDLYAEVATQLALYRRLERYNPYAIGEETLRDESLDLSVLSNLVVLMDMVDGTDLLERGLSNWCSALVFYFPPERRILASFVGIPEDGVYFATEDMTEQKQPLKRLFYGEPKERSVSGPSNIESLDSASIAYYGQKINNFLSISSHQNFTSHLKSLNNPKTRIYNLAGNPMMMKLIDGHTKIDAVFDLEGQAPHDVVPGVYIAQKAGAVFCDLSGKSIDLNQTYLGQQLWIHESAIFSHPRSNYRKSSANVLPIRYRLSR